MARIPLASDEQCQAREAQLAARGAPKSVAVDFVPNMTRLLSVRLDIGVPFGELYRRLMMGESRLTRAQREMIAVVTSNASRCHY